MEDLLGRWRYLLLIFVSTVAGDLLHLLTQSHATVPCIGASGGISGVIVFYALQFPRARLSFIYFRIRFDGYFRWFHISVWFALVLWVLHQLLMAAMEIGGFGNVAATAHLGGAAMGFLLWLAWRKL